ncbi:MAG: hypothetical protein Q4A42_06145, partial [Tissierellia bacterium]|nr:hypothetical protein [Tissierellia bacterium]
DKKQEEKKDNENKDTENNDKSYPVGEMVEPKRNVVWGTAVIVNAPKNGAIKGGDHNIFYEEGKKKVVLSTFILDKIELSSIDEKFVVGSEYSLAAGSLAGSLNTSISQDSVKWEDAKFEDMEINGFKVKRFSGIKRFKKQDGTLTDSKSYFISYFVNAADHTGKESTYVLSVGVNEKSLDLKEDADKIADQVMQTLRKDEATKY